MSTTAPAAPASVVPTSRPEWAAVEAHAKRLSSSHLRDLFKADAGRGPSLAFEGPAYAADVLVQREGGQYEGTITRHGMVALINDLHKGRDTGIPWSVVIDLSAVLMAVSAITGLVLLYSIKRKRVAGTLTALAGTLVLWLAYRWLVP